MLRRMAQECDEVPYKYKHYTPRTWFKNTPVNISNPQECVERIRSDRNATKQCQATNCRSVCGSTTYETAFRLQAADAPTKHFLTMDFVIDKMVQRITEKPDHTWQQLFANFGGVLGLLCGASVLSFVELFVYLGLLIYAKMYGGKSE